MDNTFENNFYNAHIKADLTTLINDLKSTRDYSELSHVMTYIDFEECLLDLDNDDSLEYSGYKYNFCEDEQLWFLHIEGKELETFGNKTDMICELMYHFNIPLNNYRYVINTWVAVSQQFGEYLTEKGERVIEWNGLTIWGTHRNFRSEPIYTLNMVQYFLQENS